MRTFLILLFFIVPGIASAFTYEGMKGHIANYTNIPNKELIVEVQVCWKRLVFDSCDKLSTADTKVKSNGDFELKSRKFICLLCLGDVNATATVKSQDGKLWQSISAYGDKNLTLLELKQEKVHAQTVDGRSIEEWMKAKDSPRYLAYGLNYYLEGEEKPLFTRTPNWEKAQTSDLPFSEQYIILDRTIAKGKKLTAVLTSNVGTQGYENIQFAKITKNLVFPEVQLPEEFKNIELDSGKLNFDVSGVYSKGQIANAMTIKKAEFDCNNGNLTGEFMLSNGTIVNVNGTCEFGKASFPLDVTLEQNGWSKRLTGTVELKVFGHRAAGYVVVEEGYDQEISFSK